SGRWYSPDRRSGSLSKREPRNSTKLVRIGAGRARIRSTQSLSTDAPGSAACGAAEAIAAAPSSSADSSIGSPFGRGLRLLMHVPEVIEVEPVVGRLPRMMFQPARVTLGERGDARGPLRARQVEAVFGEWLEQQVVAVAATIQAEGQPHGHFQYPGDQPRRH